jgi:hypothetical protein
MLLERATSATHATSLRREAEYLLHDDGGMPFVAADLPVLLASANSTARIPLLASAIPLVEERQRRLALSAPQRVAAARAAGLTPNQLLAARAGLDDGALRALVEDVLRGTKSLLQRTPASVADLPALHATIEAEYDPRSATQGVFMQPLVSQRVQSSGMVPGCAVVDPPQDVRLLDAVVAPPSLMRYARAYCSAATRLPEAKWDPLWLHTVARLFASVTWSDRIEAGTPVARARRRAAYLLILRGYALEIDVLLQRSPPDSAAELDDVVIHWGTDKSRRIAGASALLPFDVSGLAADLLVAEVVSAAIDNAFVARFGPDWARRPEAANDVEQELELLASAWQRGGAVATLRALGLLDLDAGPLLRRWERL